MLCVYIFDFNFFSLHHFLCIVIWKSPLGKKMSLFRGSFLICAKICAKNAYCFVLVLKWWAMKNVESWSWFSWQWEICWRKPSSRRRRRRSLSLCQKCAKSASWYIFWLTWLGIGRNFFIIDDFDEHKEDGDKYQVEEEEEKEEEEEGEGEEGEQREKKHKRRKEIINQSTIW